MPPLVTEVGKVELFIHDSLHTFKNTLFEMEQAASVMRPGGVMLIDDIKSRRLRDLRPPHPSSRPFTCPLRIASGHSASPFTPDPPGW